MPTLAEIECDIKKLDGMSKFLGWKEIRELPNILWEDEKLEKLTPGYYGKGNGILVATNKRVIFIDKGLIYGLRVEDFGYDKITSIQYETGIAWGKVTIFASGNRADITQMNKDQARNFSEYVRARITGISKHASSSDSTKSASEEDIVAKLEKLAMLKEKGILTEKEFLSQKKKMLNT